MSGIHGTRERSRRKIAAFDRRAQKMSRHSVQRYPYYSFARTEAIYNLLWGGVYGTRESQVRSDESITSVWLKVDNVHLRSSRNLL